MDQANIKVMNACVSPATTSMIRHVVIVVALFIFAGVCEIGGGWLVWKAIREPDTIQNRSKTVRVLMATGGAVLLAGYGFVVTLQPLDDFGRLFAAYGGAFMAMSLLWAAVFDGFHPDKYDFIGSCVAILGASIILFAPRHCAKGASDNDQAYSPL